MHLLLWHIDKTLLDEAIKKYGLEEVTIYKSKFIPMYYAVMERKEPSIMKVVCVGKQEKVFQVSFYVFAHFQSNKGI